MHGPDVIPVTDAEIEELALTSLGTGPRHQSVRWFPNEPLLIGTIAAIYVVILGSVYLIARLLTNWTRARKARLAAAS